MDATNAFVLDGSVTLVWGFDDEADAAYLELTSRLGLPLATLDGELRTAAQAIGVPLFDPRE